MKDLSEIRKAYKAPVDEKLDVKKALAKVKGITKQQTQMFMSLPTPLLTNIIQQLSSLTMSNEEKDGPCWPGYKQVGTKMKNGKEVPNCVPIGEDLDEAPLVMSDMDMVRSILKKVEDDITKLSLRKKIEQAWPKIQVLAKMAGFKVTKSAQEKGRIFRSDIKK
jgi:hypothetical protein